MSFYCHYKENPYIAHLKQNRTNIKNISLRIDCNNVELDLHNKKARWRVWLAIMNRAFS
jgi:hypothetical protein